MRRTTFGLLATAIAAAVLLSGCGPAFIREELPIGRGTKTIEAGDARIVRARIEMGVGELNVRPGSESLMQGDFTYRPDKYAPEVSYSVDASAGDLLVRQPDTNGMRFGDAPWRSEWTVSLSPTTPLDLTVERGAGTTRLDVGSLDLTNLNVRSGAGDTTLDLTGTPRSDLGVLLESGVGRVVVRVSRTTGVRVTGIHDGVGDMRIDGFHSDGGDEAVNDAWSGGGKRIDIRLTRGVGEVRIEQQ